MSRASASEILDNKKAVLALDPSGSFHDELHFSENLKKAIKNVKALKLPSAMKVGHHAVRYSEVGNVVFAGMGGSAIVGDLLKDWVRDDVKVPLETIRGYHLPAYAGHDTLVFLISYSGNTEETMSCMVDAVERGCKIVCISSNGALQRAARALSLPLIGLPKVAAARVSFPYLFAPLPYMLAKLNLLSMEKVEWEMRDAASMVGDLSKKLSLDAPFEANFAKKAAYRIFGTVPIIYSSCSYRSIGLRFKTQVNENCKLPARFDFFPELNHNEIMGWEASKRITHHYTVVLLRSKDEQEEVKTRIEILKERFFEKKARSILEIEAQGRSQLARMFNLLFTADMISLYLSVLHQRNPVASKTFQILKYNVTRQLHTLERLEKRIQELAGLSLHQSSQ